MARGLCLAQSCGLTGTVAIDGQNVTMVQGYPSRATIQLAVQSTDGFTFANQGANAVRFTKIGAGNNCWVQYNQATAASPPTIQFRAGVAGIPGVPGVVSEAAIDAMLRTDCR
jgi:hypothetical protein